MEIVPEVGVYSPTISFSKVDFPVPFAPINPTRSPGFICQFASSYKALEPIRKVKSLIAIIWRKGRKKVVVIRAYYCECFRLLSNGCSYTYAHSIIAIACSDSSERNEEAI